MRALLFLLWGGLLFGGQLQDQLREQLTVSGQTSFSHIDLALIAGGLETAEQLVAYRDRYSALTEKLKLTKGQARQKGARKAKTIHRKVFAFLKKEDKAAQGLASLIDDRTYNRLSATFLFLDLCIKDGLGPADYGEVVEQLDPFFMTREDPLRDIAAAFLVHQAVALPDDRYVEILSLLDLSRLLVGKSNHGTGNYDVQLYNRALNLYQGGNQVAATRLAIGGALRYPALMEFQGLCYNIGIKLFQTAGKGGDYQMVTEVGHMLAPHTGQYREGFEKTLATVYYNHAVNLFNENKWEETLERLAHANPEQDGYRLLLVGSLEKLIDDRLTAGRTDEIPELMTRLNTVDPKRAEYMKTRMGQMELKLLDASGDHGQALELASQDIDSDIGRNNYFSVLTRYVQARRQEGIAQSLEVLGKVPAALVNESVVSNLRFNTYVFWLKKYEDKQYKEIIPIYQGLFADERLKISSEDRIAFEESYGNAMYFEIEYMIGERQFKEADEKSRAALKMLPEHEALLRQRTLVDTILKRLED